MRVEFNQGVPTGCVEWLWENIGPGNLVPEKYEAPTIDQYAWVYERIKISVHPCAFGDDPFKYVPTITVKDPEMALLFKLRWT